VLAGRNPMLLLRFAGSFLLRLAERTFTGLLLNAPPRNRRLLGRRPAKGVFDEQPLAQSMGIGLPGVANPAHYPLADLSLGDLIGGVLLLHLAQSAAKRPDVGLRQQAVRGKDAIAEEWNALPDRKQNGLPGVKTQPKAGQQVGPLLA